MNKDTIERMRREREELLDRLERLYDFRCSISYADVSPANVALINRQAEAMRQYVDILTIRIELNEKEVK